LDILIKEMGFETGLTKQVILSKHLCWIDSQISVGGTRGKRNDNLILGAMKRKQFSFSRAMVLSNRFRLLWEMQ
jgi:hypothetical protein